MLLAIDWGTSSLRGALLDARGQVLDERGAPRGIMTVAPGEFPAVLRDTFGDWLQRCDLTLICGMAGSRQGWVEAPYCACPAGFADVTRQLAWVEPGRIAIVPGLSCEHDGAPDAMRGEETQVFGALQLLGIDAKEAIGRFCGDVLNPRPVGNELPCERHCPIKHARQGGEGRSVEYLATPSGMPTTAGW